MSHICVAFVSEKNHSAAVVTAKEDCHLLLDSTLHIVCLPCWPLLQIWGRRVRMQASTASSEIAFPLARSCALKFRSPWLLPGLKIRKMRQRNLTWSIIPHPPLGTCPQAPPTLGKFRSCTKGATCCSRFLWSPVLPHYTLPGPSLSRFGSLRLVPPWSCALVDAVQHGVHSFQTQLWRPSPEWHAQLAVAGLVVFVAVAITGYESLCLLGGRLVCWLAGLLVCSAPLLCLSGSLCLVFRCASRSSSAFLTHTVSWYNPSPWFSDSRSLVDMRGSRKPEFQSRCSPEDISSPSDQCVRSLLWHNQVWGPWRRGFLLTIFFFLRFRRIGEASNPGPFRYGGSSSSLFGIEPPSIAQGNTALHSGCFSNFDDPEAGIWEDEFSPLDYECIAEHRVAGSEAAPVVPGALGQWPQTAAPSSPEAHSDPLGGLGWDTRQSEVGPTRLGMSSAEIAYRWQAKQEADRVAESNLELEKQWSHLDAGHSSQCYVWPKSSLTAGLEDLQQSKTYICKWKPEVESDSKKAAKWRERQRKARAEHSPASAGLADSALTNGLVDKLCISHSEGSACSSPLRAQGRPKRASRKPKILDIYM